MRVVVAGKAAPFRPIAAAPESAQRAPGIRPVGPRPHGRQSRGCLECAGAFTAWTSDPENFAPTGAHLTVLDGTNPQGVYLYYAGTDEGGRVTDGLLVSGLLSVAAGQSALVGGLLKPTWLRRRRDARLCRNLQSSGTEVRVGSVRMTQITALVLRAVAGGYQYGFDVMEACDLASGTVYPALRRLEKAGLLKSAWEDTAEAHADGRPRRRTYRLTPAGADAMAEAEARLAETRRLLEELPARTREA